MKNTLLFAIDNKTDGVKLQLLHVLRDSRLYEEFEKGNVKTLTQAEYLEILMGLIPLIPEDVAVHRLTGDGNKNTLVAPLWSADKKAVLNSVARIIKLTEKHRGYAFRKIEKEEIPVMFGIILSRMKWMDEVGIDQWNNTFYDEVYPLSYYEEHRKAGEVFVLEELSTGEIVSAAVLKAKDDRWEHIADYKTKSAFYLHNFCARIDKKGAGAVFLDFAEEYARVCKKDVFRLDSADDNKVLEEYYTKRNYKPCGFCVDGLYKGTLREKNIR